MVSILVLGAYLIGLLMGLILSKLTLHNSNNFKPAGKYYEQDYIDLIQWLTDGNILSAMENYRDHLKEGE